MTRAASSRTRSNLRRASGSSTASRRMPAEFIVHRAHRNDYDHALRTAGARFVEVGFDYCTFPYEVESAIGPATAALFYQANGAGSVVPLDEFAGQEHFLGPGKLLRRMLEADRLSSVIFYGPPGTGKTTLAQIIAYYSKSHFEQVNAASIGVKEVRQVLDLMDRAFEHHPRGYLPSDIMFPPPLLGGKESLKLAHDCPTAPV